MSAFHPVHAIRPNDSKSQQRTVGSRPKQRCDANGLSVNSDFGLLPNAALQKCNQSLCDGAKGTGRKGTQVRLFFMLVPSWLGNQCSWSR